MSSGSPITQLLFSASRGDEHAASRLWSAVYEELHRLAKAQLAREGAGCAMQTTSLVNEAYLRLVGKEPVEWANRRHFFGAAAKAMRRILVDDARNRRSLKRGAGRRLASMHHEPAMLASDFAEILALDEALQGLEQHDARRAEVVMLRYFAGLSVDETAAAMGLSARTVDSEWRFARAWLHRALSKDDSR